MRTVEHCPPPGREVRTVDGQLLDSYLLAHFVGIDLGDAATYTGADGLAAGSHRALEHLEPTERGQSFQPAFVPVSAQSATGQR